MSGKVLHMTSPVHPLISDILRPFAPKDTGAAPSSPHDKAAPVAYELLGDLARRAMHESDNWYKRQRCAELLQERMLEDM